MRDPAREEDTGPGTARWHTGIDAHMIDGHEDHDDAARNVDGVDASVGLHGRTSSRAGGTCAESV